MLDDYIAAGEAFRWATAVAILIACGLSSGAILEDKDAKTLEIIISSGISSFKYALGKLLSLFIILITPAMLLAVTLIVFRLSTGWTPDLFPYFLAIVYIYILPVLFALLFGLLFSAVSGSKALPVLAFVLMWSACFFGTLLFPSFMLTVDVTGSAMYELFSHQEINNVSIVDGVPNEILQAALSSSNENYIAATLNPFFLLSGITVQITLLLFMLRRFWKTDASPLISNRFPIVFFETTLPQLLLEVKTISISRLFFIVFIALITCLLLPISKDPLGVGVTLIGSFTPLCFAFAYAGLFSRDAKAKIIEFGLSLPRYQRPYVRRIALVTSTMIAVVCIQAFNWGEAMSVSFFTLAATGIIPSLLLGSFAYLLGIFTGNEATSCTFVAGLWVFLHLPVVVEAIAGSPLFWLYPFPITSSASLLSMGFEDILLTIAAAAMFGIGQVILGKPERLVK